VIALHDDADLARVQRGAIAFGAAGLLLSAIGAVFSPAAFFQAYLVGFLFSLGIPLGCLAIMMLHYLSGGGWGVVVRRISESATATLPLLALLFVPIAAGVHVLYLWARPEVVAADPVLQAKHAFLNVRFFIVRAVFYFVAWIAVARVLDRWSRQRDTVAEVDPRRFRLFAGPGLVLYGLTVTFASIDWAMSLDPHWYSTIYPLMLGVGQVLTAFAFTITMAVLLRHRHPFGRLVNPANLIDLGNLLLTFVLLWAYLSFSQFLLIWAGNIREEVTWYVPRVGPGWKAVAVALIAIHFMLPFALLLQRAIKRTPAGLAAVAALVLAMRLVDQYWLVLPSVPGVHAFHWLYVVTPLALGALWLGAFVRELRERPLVPGNEPLVEHAMAHGHGH
jgi:hypothetical protein